MSRRAIMAGSAGGAGVVVVIAGHRCRGGPAARHGESGDCSGHVGFGTDLAAADTTQYGDIELVGRSLKQLGIKDLREPMVLRSTNETQARTQREGWKRLAETVPGLTVTSVIGKIDNSQGTVAEYADYVRGSLGGGAGVVAGVENGNEPNAPKRRWNHDDEYGWVPLVRRRQEQMAREFGAGGLEAIDVLRPSLSGGRAPLRYEELGDISAHLDVGNFHLYPGNTATGMPSDELDAVIAGIKNNIGNAPYWCRGRHAPGARERRGDGVPSRGRRRGVHRADPARALQPRGVAGLPPSCSTSGPTPSTSMPRRTSGLVRATDPPRRSRRSRPCSGCCRCCATRDPRSPPAGGR
jgi:hypothetical protein